MAINKKKLPNHSLFNTLTKQAEAAGRYMKNYRDDSHASWEEKEAILLGRHKDQITNNTKSQIYDPILATNVFERASRVMAQHATGTVQAIDSVNDKAKNALMDMILQKYIVPGADSQWDLLTKFRMEMIYSNVYGSFGHYIDYRIDDDYVGPDMWLVPIRHIMPEPNSISETDANYIFIDTWVTRDWLESRGDQWKNINYVIDELKNKETGKSKLKDSDNISLSEEAYGDKSYGGHGKYAQVHLRTRFENDRWVTYCPDFSGLKSRSIVRDIDNPHGNNEKPIVMKHTFPMMDRFWGLGEIERGKSLQYGANSLWNLYMDGVKMSIFPPLILQANGYVPSTLKYGPGERWVETVAGAIRQHQPSVSGTNTFFNTFSALKSSLLNLSGTTDTTSSEQTDPGMGKTPAAVKFLANREAARDNWERYMMEKSIERTMNIFIDLMVTQTDKPINLELFEGEIQKIKQAFPDEAGELLEVFDSGKFARAKISPEDMAAKYRFTVDPGTTMKKDQAAEHQTMTELFTFIANLAKINPAFAEQAATGNIQVGDKVLDLGEAIKRYIISSGAQDWENIVREVDPEEQAQQQQLDLSAFADSDPRVQQVAQAIAQSVGGQPNV